MELRDSKRWIKANYGLLAALSVCASMSQIPYKWGEYFNISKSYGEDLIALLAAGPIYLSVRMFVSAVEHYEPATPLEAKRANEQIKLTANFANAAANTFAGVIAIGQLVRSDGPNNGLIALGILLAALIHSFGRAFVSHLKDENLK